MGTAPNINLQYELLIIRIIRSIESVKQRQLHLTQIQLFCIRTLKYEVRMRRLAVIAIS